MATIKAKVIGQCTVGGVAPGGTVDLAELEALGANVQALIDGEHIELLPEPKPVKKAAPKKGDD